MKAAIKGAAKIAERDGPSSLSVNRNADTVPVVDTECCLVFLGFDGNPQV